MEEVHPNPLLSLTLLVKDCEELPEPLQQISWKRQLVGKKFRYSSPKKIGGSATQQQRTVVEIRSRNSSSKVLFEVDSIAARSMSKFDVGHFIVIPSTRITLKPLMTTKSSSSLADLSWKPNTKVPCLTTSPVAKYLLETFQCMQQDIPSPRTFLLSGPPGVGKTFSVRKALEAWPNRNTHFVSLRGSELLQQHSNPALALQTEFRKAAALSLASVDNSSTSTAAKKKLATPILSLIFLDECDALVSVGSMAAMLANLLDRVASDWNWRYLVVVGATNRIDSLPNYLRRSGRFDKEIPLAPPKIEDRIAILKSLLSDSIQGHHVSKPGSLSPDEKKAEDDDDDDDDDDDKDIIRRVSELCIGYVPADLSALVRRASILAIQSSLAEKSSLVDPAKHVVDYLERAMVDVGASALRDAALMAPPKITWEDIAGDPGGAKTALRQAIEWPRTMKKDFERLGLVPPRGILLHGPPGCAKTTLARAAAGASGIAFVSLSPAEVYASSYVGEAEAIVRRAFALARSAAPCILFFDEMDAIFGGVEDGGRGGTAEARVLSTFLNEMDGVDNHKGADGVLVLGATNRPWTLDSALLRPGRLGDKIIYIPPPDQAARRAILERQFPEASRGKLDLDLLASDEVTGNMTGAELVGGCQEAKLRFLRSVDFLDANLRAREMTEDFLVESIHGIKPLLNSPSALEEFRLFEQGNASR